MPQLDFVAALAAFIVVSLLYIKRNYERSLSRLPLPPGPRGLPIIGNLKDMPSSFEWKTYHKWSKELNTDILHVNLAGTTLIVLDTSEAAIELLEKRSSIYSGRSRMPMINELMGFHFNFGFMDYGDRWRAHRRVMHHSFHPAAARQFRPHLLKATRNFLNKVLDDPRGDVTENLRLMAGETIISIAYGLDVLPQNDPYIAAAEEAVHGLITAGVPGAFLVDSLPILKYVPEWMPGAGFQKKAKNWRKLARRMIDAPFEAAKRNIANSISNPSFVSTSLEKASDKMNDDAYSEDIIQGTAGSMYSAGSDTTMATISFCILGLLQRPDVLKRAREEVDSVLKPGHLPDFQDEPSMPFITAIVKETLRWQDIVPIAIPHLLQVDDEYKGYRLPAGSIVIPNAWAMLHDEEAYPQPFEFMPERFMKDGKIDKSVRDPAHACWGFGRRICPARYMAFSAVWIAVASLIAVFDIEKAVDENGDVIEPDYECLPGLVCYPKPYKSVITPRSKEAEMSIRESLNQNFF